MPFYPEVWFSFLVTQLEEVGYRHCAVEKMLLVSQEGDGGK